MYMANRVLRVAALALVAVIGWSAPASAGSASVSLVRSSLNNVDDAAGRWQHEGGDIVKNGAVVGQYAIHRRVTFGGTDTLNTAMVTAHELPVPLLVGGIAPNSRLLREAFSAHQSSKPPTRQPLRRLPMNGAGGPLWIDVCELTVEYIDG